MVTIEVDDATAQGLTTRAAACNMTPADYLRTLFAPPPTASTLSPEERAAAARAWAESHEPVTHFVDDSRETIYEGRGE